MGDKADFGLLGRPLVVGPQNIFDKILEIVPFYCKYISKVFPEKN